MPSLNDDVLGEVVYYLHGSDALFFSLTSKHIHNLAIHRVSAVIECRRTDMLRLLHRTIVRDNPSRAKYIRKLVIRQSVFTDEELHPSDPDADWDYLYLSDSELGSSEPTPAPPITPLIVDLLRVAPNILSLILDRFDILHRVSEAGVLEQMATLAQLSELELSKVSLGHLLAEENHETEVPPFLQASRCHIVVLSLECCFDGQDHHRLLHVVAAFPQLLTLRLIGFHPTYSFLSDPPDHTQRSSSTTPLTMPSVRRLFLKSTTPAALDLVGLCPNVSLVSVGFCSDRLISTWNSDQVSAWNQLGSIILSCQAGLHHAKAMLGPARHLQIVPQLRCGGSRYGPDIAQLLGDIVKKVSPVRMQVSVAVGREPMYFWKHVAGFAPRLRFLELKVALQDGRLEPQDKAISWLVNIPDALGSLPLVCLRLHLSKLPRSYWSRSPARSFGRPVVVGHSSISWDAIKKTYKAGEEMRKKLPQRCAGAIRTLKYIAVANEEPSWDSDGDSAHDTRSNRAQRSDWQSADERYGGGADEYEYQNEWYAEKIKTLRWWRIERSVKGKRTRTKLRPLTPEKGREVQRFFEEADFESIERIDELLP